MKKFYFLFVIVLLSFLVKGQQIYNIPNNLKDSNRSIKDVFIISNETTKNLTLFIDDNKTFNAYLYDKDMQRLDELSSEGLPNRYNEIIGYIQKENQTILFLKHGNNKNFGAIIFNFKTKKSSEIEFDFKLKKGEYIESLSKNGKFYLLSTDKKKSVINCFEFTGIDYKEHQIVLNQDFRIEDNKQKNLYEMLKNLKKSSPDPLEIRKMDTNYPIGVAWAGAMNKLYETEKGFELTLDKSIYETYLIDVDLNKYNAEIEHFEKPYFSTKERFFSKSFLLNDNIYQIVGNSEELFFEARNRETGKLLKEIHLNDDEKITFANTPDIQDEDGDMYIPKDELKKTSKFLKKIDNEDIAVSVQKDNNRYVVNIGSYSKAYHGNTAVSIGPMGMVQVMPYGDNFDQSPYLWYAYTNPIRIKCLFDSNFNHIEGEVPENAFDRIKKYAKTLHDQIAENVFKWNNKIYYAYYNKETEAYRIVDFSK
ncbi:MULTISPECIES: hypothetical protein [Mesonia]|uniref:Uncharacterized protein n=1 Tax=Mesonia oceanica TaxID=2687242 RepID=A0AC61Y458_9FLAO|nr:MULTISPECIES: hypothetical protein [Mesonia]MAN26894.1 hypothetical protein [Mesonia sp.]MAQ41694.1 hypothetical protein [Mesonia sp.]MBJ96566.1 hypothetical protein [Flavobacteriaceae bacterium]VVU99108.1 hypothetical protein FVB9532_00360 [Mesonia oceanica]|tara:strand:+ start:7325 stop:8761 length:1437 start_codon:yes stop_codon:yes gene_type:complete